MPFHDMQVSTIMYSTCKYCHYYHSNQIWKVKNCSLLDAVVIVILHTVQSTQISLYKYMHTYAYACELSNITTMGVCIHVCEHVVSEYDDWIIITCYVYALRFIK